MNITLKKAGFPILSDFPGSSIFADRDPFDFSGEGLPSRLGITLPGANVRETLKEYFVELAAPGLERKDFKVEVDNHVLKISAERSEENKVADDEYARREYSFSSFIRTFALPDDVSEGGIDARYENGVLKVCIPKVKESGVKAVRKIAVL